MSGDLNIALVGAVFVASVTTVIALGLITISAVMRSQAKHRKRISRVSRNHLAGRLTIDEARLNLAKKNHSGGRLSSVTDLLAVFFPLLNTNRLRLNFQRAGLQMSVVSFVAYSFIPAVFLFVAGFFVSGLPWFLLILPAFVAGMFLMDIFVKARGDRNLNKFMNQLPDALDTIIRGIRSGLPVVECIGSVGKEFPDPIGGYFKSISERVRLGETLDSSLWSVARIVDRPEVDFFAVSISIQMETGGSLAEALSNLADLLRKRQQMKLKVKAISSEAKASALIIGALPFLMLALLSVMAPEYVGPLFTDPRGHLMLLAGGSSITIGAFIMWRMTQFEI